MLDNAAASGAPSSSDAFASQENGVTNKRKRRPAGTPDPDAVVVSLSPKTLLESTRYVCEICNRGFQRDQNLQMHRRRHRVPWKLLKRETQEVKKRVFVCPEPSCLHHDPGHALGDLVGIKKHFRRKHGNHKQWVCEKCSKGYAVQSDYKAHLKTCGTRGHSCDCGRVFSRVESFIEHQDACTVREARPAEIQSLQPACSSRTASSTSPSISDTNNISTTLLPGSLMSKPAEVPASLSSDQKNLHSTSERNHNLELQLLLSPRALSLRNSDDTCATHLNLSIGSCDGSEKNESNKPTWEVTRVNESEKEELKLAIAEKAYSEETRREAKREIELAELEFTKAKTIRQNAQAELEKAQLLKDQATKKASCSTMLQITCQACKQKFQASMVAAPSVETSHAVSYVSSAMTQGEGE
ncbi:zinc finger protein SHOOT GRAVITROPISM 5-like [Juglans microcarpa x Juglans regia]|uniref:zinc finger protein SHOOT GRAVITROPISM 5-like n=1 Tax=Juglans microcarpa x Juglans regia TaxID=2249226 RepID=UPI001B7DFDA4|nr:zinc finger protein SHOOT GRAVITROPISM 5-like [Juglans microcarpa x Juglans regia]